MSTTQNQPGAAWMAVVRKNGSPEFADAFDPNVQLAASVLPEVLTGPDSVSAVFGETRTMYESIAFTQEAVEGPHTYMTWEGRYQGSQVSGATILTHNDAGKITFVQLFHRPLDVVKQFAQELEQRLAARQKT